MSRLSRRSLLAGAASASTLVALNRFAPTRLARAQGSGYEIISFGPLTTGVRTAGDFVPFFGGITGIDANGMAFGNTATSEEKLTPTLFMPDGSVSKLKSGKFGGDVLDINAEGHAAGKVFESEESREAWDFKGQTPAVWIDGELTRLPLPDPKTESSTIGGTTIAISDDGAILGQASGHSVLWVDGEPQILPITTGGDLSLSYLDLTPNGTLIARTSDSSGGETIYRYGSIEDGEFTAFDLPEGTSVGWPANAKSNSANEVLLRFWPTDLQFNVIVVPGGDPIIIDHREDGISFSGASFNANHTLVGYLQMRAGDDSRTALLQDGEFMFLEDLLPAGHGYQNMFTNGISDEGVISGGGYDENGDLHPLLFVPV